MLLETMLASAVLPAALDIVKSVGQAISRKFIGVSVDDEIKLRNADVSRMQALAALDNPYGTPSQWVINLRASFRYIAAGVSIIIGSCIIAYGLSIQQKELAMLGLDLISIPYSFTFGERLWMGLKGTK